MFAPPTEAQQIEYERKRKEGRNEKRKKEKTNKRTTKNKNGKPALRAPVEGNSDNNCNDGTDNNTSNDTIPFHPY